MLYFADVSCYLPKQMPTSLHDDDDIIMRWWLLLHIPSSSSSNSSVYLFMSIYLVIPFAARNCNNARSNHFNIRYIIFQITPPPTTTKPLTSTLFPVYYNVIQCSQIILLFTQQAEPQSHWNRYKIFYNIMDHLSLKSHRK